MICLRSAANDNLFPHSDSLASGHSPASHRMVSRPQPYLNKAFAFFSDSAISSGVIEPPSRRQTYSGVTQAGSIELERTSFSKNVFSRPTRSTSKRSSGPSGSYAPSLHSRITVPLSRTSTPCHWPMGNVQRHAIRPGSQVKRLRHLAGLIIKHIFQPLDNPQNLLVFRNALQSSGGQAPSSERSSKPMLLKSSTDMKNISSVSAISMKNDAKLSCSWPMYHNPYPGFLA